jgi:hypothetical protein
MREGIKPFVAGAVRISQTETMTTILVKVKFDRYAGFKP